MNITGADNHPNYWRDYFSDCPVIKLDGNIIDHVIEADDVAGYVIVTLYKPDGTLQLDETGQAIKTERRLGRVEIQGRIIGL